MMIVSAPGACHKLMNIRFRNSSNLVPVGTGDSGALNLSRSRVLGNQGYRACVQIIKGYKVQTPSQTYIALN